jgi:hypothetical protein
VVSVRNPQYLPIGKPMCIEILFCYEINCTSLLRCPVLAAKFMYVSQFQAPALEAGMLYRLAYTPRPSAELNFNRTARLFSEVRL